MCDGSAENTITIADVMKRIDNMATWAQGINRQLNGVDVATLWAEADALVTQYDAVPAEIRALEQSKATLEASVADLRESYELIEANLILSCNGKNPEHRKAQLRIALADNEKAGELANEIATKELSIKLLKVEIQEKEKVWSDYHRKVTILASKAGISYR